MSKGKNSKSRSKGLTPRGSNPGGKRKQNQPLKARSPRSTTRGSKVTAKRSPGAVGNRDGSTIRTATTSSLRKNIRKANSLVSVDALSSSFDEMAFSLSTRVDSSLEDVVINPSPWIVAQYLYGVLMRPFSRSDDANELKLVLDVFYTLMLQFVDMGNGAYDDVDMPQAFVELRAALRPRQVGKFSYSTDFTSFISWASDFATNGFTSTNWWDGGVASGFAFYTGNVDTYGYFTVTETPNTGLSVNSVRRFFTTYASYYETTTYMKWTAKCDNKGPDASAFAYDPAGSQFLSPGALPNSNNNTMWSHTGITTASGVCGMRQTGVAALETPIRSPHLAALRLGTTHPGCVTTGTAPLTAPSRRPRHDIVVTAPPSLLGWNYGSLGAFSGPVQLKPVPATNSAQDVINRLEALVNTVDAVSTGFKTSWTSTFSSNDIKQLAVMYIRAQLATYSGAYCGTALVSRNTLVGPSRPEAHAGNFLLKTSRVPEFLGKCLGSFKPSENKDGTLVPWLAASNPSTLTTSFTYTGTGIGAIPTNETSWGSYQSYPLVSKLRPFEIKLAMVTNITLQSALGPSNLDTTVLLGYISGNVLGFSSRSPISDDRLIKLLECVAYLSYDYVEDPSTRVMMIGNINKEYAQHHLRTFSCGITIPVLAGVSVNDGFVLNGFAENVLDASGENRPVIGDELFQGLYSGPGSLLDQSVSKVIKDPKANIGLVGRMFSRVVPRKGNYCGPAWTAGTRTFESELIVNEHGEFLVSPTSPEDAICKVHDEAYRSAQGDKRKIRAADDEMIASLDKLEHLSLYGRAARNAIWIKAHLPFKVWD